MHGHLTEVSAETTQVVFLMMLHLQDDEWFPLHAQYESVEEAQAAYEALMQDDDYDFDDKIRVVEITTTTITRDITPSATAKVDHE